MPFRFGAITMRASPLLTIAVEIEDEAGRRATGHAADFLAYRWFDKRPERSLADNCRDLLASVRDYAQAKVANDQNEVMKRLTVIASLLLLPTFIVGLYGQNFADIPELRWRLGYAFSWGVIVVTTLLQLWWFRRKRWF